MPVQTTNLTLENPQQASPSPGPMSTHGNSDPYEGEIRLSKQQSIRQARRMNKGWNCVNLPLHESQRIVQPFHLGAREFMQDRVLDIREMAGDPSHLGPLHRTLILDILRRGLRRERIAGNDDRRNNQLKFTRFHPNSPRPIDFSRPNAVKRIFIVYVPERILNGPFDAKESFWFHYLFQNQPQP